MTHLRDLAVPAPAIPRDDARSLDSVHARWAVVGSGGTARAALLDDVTCAAFQDYGNAIENFIGTVKVPVGLAGPLRVNGERAGGDYCIPLATTEAALVASISRGAQLLTRSGGCTATVIDEGIQRSPGFAFRDARDARRFVEWIREEDARLRQVAQATTRHGHLSAVRSTIEGNHVYLDVVFTTGDAAGQNIATFATEAVCRYIAAHSPVRSSFACIESNHSGDKKASALAMSGVRGRRVVAEARLAPALVETLLHATPARMIEYWRMSVIGGVLSGTLGVQGHYANALAALFIACGQDAACVAEGAVGVTRLEEEPDGTLYAAVTLPALIVGTVGGGTALPGQRACLELLGLHGAGHAHAFAEVCAAVALAGELSIIGALAAGEFAAAHAQLARRVGST